jgi:excisionase family DNA binding protein
MATTTVPHAPVPLLTVREVEQILRRSKWSLYADVKRGDLQAIRLGRDLRFRPEDIERYLAARTTTARSGAA